MLALGYKVVGYIRVSTKRQAEQGLSLDGQAEAIRQWAERHSYNLLSIEEDDCSAHGPAGLARPGLRAAIARARSEGVPIVVTSIDRLSRDVKSLKVLGLDDIHIITTSSKRRVGKRRLRDLVRAAQDEIADLSAHGQASQRSAKRTRSNLRPEDRRAGALGNLDRVDEKIQSLIEQIRKHPDLVTMSWPQRVDHLNGQDALNLRSRKLQIRKPWTIGSLRKPFNRALEEMRIQAELDEQDMVEDFYRGRQRAAGDPCSHGGEQTLSTSSHASERPSGTSAVVSATDPVVGSHAGQSAAQDATQTSLTQEEVERFVVIQEFFKDDPDDLLDRLGVDGAKMPDWRNVLAGGCVPEDVAGRVRELLERSRNWGRF